MTLTVANGEKLVVQGIAVINVRFGNSVFKVPMLVVRDIRHTCILGSDFFERESCTVLERSWFKGMKSQSFISERLQASAVSWLKRKLS